MGDAYIVRRGAGGEGFSKCTIVVHTEHGSTVAAYSNSAATTKVKDAKEVGASGSYVITGLNTGTYYVKAAKGSQSKISSAITFSTDAVKEVTLNYELVLFDGSNGGDNTTVTGGWIGAGHVWSSSMLTVSSTQIVLDASNLSIDSGTTKMWLFGTRNTINLSQYSQLHMTVSSIQYSMTDSRLDVLTNVSVSGGTSFESGDPVASKVFSATGEVTLDISSITTSKHVGASFHTQGYAPAAGKLIVTKIWLT